MSELRQAEAGWTVWAEGLEFSGVLPLTVAADLLRRVRNAADHGSADYVPVAFEANEAIAAEYATAEEVAAAFHPVVSGEVLHTVAMPGAFVEFVSCSGLAAGICDSDELSKAARLAFEGGKIKRHGKSYSKAVQGTRATLDRFTEYARAIVSDGKEWSTAERSGARKWIERVNAL
ncbi:hypothetical protein ACN20G_14410 [Streptomyces sp. BI20]|uniref:hypothetical protein n=1 Tax=Streptomyces sp. BI20 TaxID=3403460 RepID=UPI003C757B46